jgi:uncharacterized protein (UPF0332 family)
MSEYRSEYITYRLSKAYESLNDAKLLAENESWNASVNRLYYACYYAVSALLLQKDVTTQTHTGLKTQFNLLFIKTGIISIEQGRLYADLMDFRQKGDYGDMFDFDKETVESLIKPVCELLDTVRSMVNKQIGEI